MALQHAAQDAVAASRTGINVDCKGHMYCPSISMSDCSGSTKLFVVTPQRKAYAVELYLGNLHRFTEVK